MYFGLKIGTVKEPKLCPILGSLPIFLGFYLTDLESFGSTTSPVRHLIKCYLQWRKKEKKWKERKNG